MVADDIFGSEDKKFKLETNREGMAPYWTAEDAPEFIKRTGTKYYRSPLKKVLDERGLENRLLNNLVKHLPKGAFIAGGFITSILQGDKNASDIDMFFTDGDAFANTMDLLLDLSPKGDGEAAEGLDDDDRPWAWEGYEMTGDPKKLSYGTLRYVKFEHPKRPPIQLIKLVWYEDAEHVIDTFDLTIAQFAATGNHETAGAELVFNPLGLFDLVRKRIVLHRMQFGASTLRRLIKYSKKGYWACPGAMVKICEAIPTAPLGVEKDGGLFYID